MISQTASLEIALASLTELETKALVEAFASSASNGHDFGYTDDITIAGLNKKQVGGVIASLIKKEILTDVDADFNQFALVGWNEDEKTQGAVAIYTHLIKQGFEVRKPYWMS